MLLIRGLVLSALSDAVIARHAQLFMFTFCLIKVKKIKKSVCESHGQILRASGYHVRHCRNRRAPASERDGCAEQCWVSDGVSTQWTTLLFHGRVRWMQKFQPFFRSPLCLAM